MEKVIKISTIITVILCILFITVLLIAFNNMIIDHKCYVMDNETFYSNKMCKKYWNYRKEK